MHPDKMRFLSQQHPLNQLQIFQFIRYNIYRYLQLSKPTFYSTLLKFDFFW